MLTKEIPLDMLKNKIFIIFLFTVIFLPLNISHQFPKSCLLTGINNRALCINLIP